MKLLFSCLICLLLTLPMLAQAQTPDHQKREKALDLFEKSEKLYQQGHFKDASAALKEAYALVPEPVLLYNLARAMEAEGDLQGAIDAYEKYLREGDEQPDRPAVRARVQALKEIQAKVDKGQATPIVAQQQAPLPSQQMQKQAPEQSGGVASWLPWVMTGVGVAGLATGAVFLVLSSNKHDSAVKEPIQSKAQDLQDSADSYAAIGLVGLIAGSAFAAAGLGWGIITLVNSSDDTPDAETNAETNPEATTAQLLMSPTGLMLSGKF